MVWVNAYFCGKGPVKVPTCIQLLICDKTWNTANRRASWLTKTKQFPKAMQGKWNRNSLTHFQHKFYWNVMMLIHGGLMKNHVPLFIICCFGLFTKIPVKHIEIKVKKLKRQGTAKWRVLSKQTNIKTRSAGSPHTYMIWNEARPKTLKTAE